MEYIILIVTHIIKSAEFFIAEGLPEIPLNQIPDAAAALVFNFIKLVEIYLSAI